MTIPMTTTMMAMAVDVCVTTRDQVMHLIKLLMSVCMYVPWPILTRWSLFRPYPYPHCVHTQILGKYTMGAGYMRQPPLMEADPARHYHSLIDNPINPAIFVIQASPFPSPTPPSTGSLTQSSVHWQCVIIFQVVVYSLTLCPSLFRPGAGRCVRVPCLYHPVPP